MATATLVRINRDTHDKLRQLAGKQSMTSYLDDLIGSVPVPSPLEKKLDEILKNQQEIKNLLQMGWDMYRRNKYGKLVSVERMRDIKVPEWTPKPYDPANGEDLTEVMENLTGIRSGYIPGVDAALLQAYDEEHPENAPADVGFYHRDAPGQWYAVEERIKKAQDESEMEDRALSAYYDAVDAKKIKEIPFKLPGHLRYSGEDDFEQRMMSHAQHRQQCVELGLKLLAQNERKVARSRK